LQGEHEEVDNQGYSAKFCGKKSMGNQHAFNSHSIENTPKVISPRFQCTGLTDPSTDFWREMSAVR